MDNDQIAESILDGGVRDAARLMRAIDDGSPQAIEVLKRLYPHTGRAYVLGVTGSPGVGKSTLTNALVERFRSEGKTVGVVAVDPTSPFTGGAILGDRIRMQQHSTDEGVFIRSLATRGHFGGITASTRGVVTVMDAMGKDVILVETVGVGQDEVDIVRMADTTVIVTVPGLGDEVQAIKAGLLEVGDIYVVNKMDLEGAQITANQLKAMLALKNEKCCEGGWNPPVVMTCAATRRGMEELMEALSGHRAVLAANEGQLMTERKVARVRKELMELVQYSLMKIVIDKFEAVDQFDRLAHEIAEGLKDPYTACEQILNNISAE